MIEGAQALQQLPGRANPIFLEGKLLPLRAETAQALQLRDAQVVQANLHIRGDQPMLILRGTALPLPAGAPRLREGPVWLQVRAFAEGWFLQPVAAPTTGQDPTQALVSRLNQLLFHPPDRAETSQLLQSGQLPRLLTQLGRPELLPLWQGWQQEMATLEPSALARAVAGALGAEVWLARGQPPPLGDPRQLLRRLLQALREPRTSDDPIDELDIDLDLGASLRAISDSLQQLESHQVQAAQAQAQQELLLQLVIPFADADPVELEFRRPPRQGNERMPLTVNIHTRSQDLGEVWLRTQLSESQQLDLTMWALRAQVAQRARDEAPRLSGLLAEAGLKMTSMQIVHGARPSTGRDWVPSGRGMVVDMAA
jgi:hypothetical protein